MRIGDQETPLPTMIMAYSNPRWYDFVSAPYNVPFGEFIEDRIETEVFKDALWAVVGEQQRAGLDLVADSRTFAAGNYSDVVGVLLLPAGRLRALRAERHLPAVLHAPLSYLRWRHHQGRSDDGAHRQDAHRADRCAT